MRAASSARRKCVLELTDPVSALRYESASRPWSIGIKPVRVPTWEIAMETDNNPLQPIGPFPNIDYGPEQEKEVKKFVAAKDNAFREDFVPNGGEQNRGPIPGGAEPSGKGGPFNKATGVDRAGVICKGTFDVGPEGLKVTVQCGATAHIEGTPGNGVGPGEKDGKPGVATGDAHGGNVYTLGDASKKAGASSTASDGKGGAGAPAPVKDPVPDSLFFYKLTTPPEPQINDLGPSTNEPEQKAEDAAVARNDQARFGDDIAQRI
jgi:hypothetical protein